MITEILVKQARDGDDHAFEKLYEEIYKDMYRMAYYILKNKEDAEDAVSEAVFDMYRGISGLKKWESFKPWAMKILTVKCKLKLKEYCEKQAQSNEDIELESGQDVEGQVVQRTDIKRAMSCLDEEEQIIVVCSAVAGMNSDEVGSITGLKSATVRSKLSRALAKLRKRMEAGVWQR